VRVRVAVVVDMLYLSPWGYLFLENKANSQFCDLAGSLTTLPSGDPKGKSCLNKVNFLINVKTTNSNRFKEFINPMDAF
jgi:hypothetical protein